MHPNNIHQGYYDFDRLEERLPELSSFINHNPKGQKTINFANPQAVKLLNKALLLSYYQLDYWDIPEGYLCPPIPSRADYIHYGHDLIGETDHSSIQVLDIGTGANCIYPILGHQLYGWKFIGSDIDPKAINAAQEIIHQNTVLQDGIELRLQKQSNHIFKGIIEKEDFFHLTMCNPPFHASKEAAQKGTRRKWKNLNRKDPSKLNFAGQSNELWCKGGEKLFITKMIQESVEFGHHCRWFTSLVSKKEHLPYLQQQLKKVKVKTSKIIEMQYGNKQSRILAWTFRD